MDNLSYLNLTLQHFHYFISVAEQGTMTKAAEYLNVSQPLLSQKIAQLEDKLGVKLFKRHKGKLLLTAAGTLFLTDCKAFLLNINQSFTHLKENYSEKNEQIIRIGFSDGHEPSSIKRTVQLIKEAFPDTQIDVEIENRLLITEKLLNGDLDICYMVDTEKLHLNKHISYRKVYFLSLSCITNTTSALANMDHVRWHDLKGLTCFWPSSLKNSIFTKDILKYLRTNNIDLTLEFRDVDYYTLRRYLQVHDGITLTLAQTLDNPMLKLIPLGELSYPFIIAWRKSESKQLERYTERLFSISKNVIRP